MEASTVNINAQTKAELPRDRLKIHVVKCEQKTHLDFPPFLVSVGIEEFVKIRRLYSCRVRRRAEQ